MIIARWMCIALVALLAILATGDRPEAQGGKPTDGWTLHIDAKLHFPGKPEMIAHHYCKLVAGGLTQCQLFDSDGSDARPVGTEVIVPADVYNKFSAGEKKMWHYHKVEIPKVAATLPDLPADEAAKVVKSIEETYGNSLFAVGP